MGGQALPIDRSSPTPPYYVYITQYVLAGNQPVPAGGIFSRTTPIRIPSFQRGISWTDETVGRFIESDSVLLGTVILGKVGTDTAQLIDGLQRFAVGTALLSVLHPLVLSSQPNNPDAAPHFETLKPFVAAFQPVFAENHKRLLNFQRVAIKSQYEAIVEDLQLIVKSELEKVDVETYARRLTDLFIDKQIAIDLYHGFASNSQLVNAFVGLNTVRVDLTVIDLLRATLIDQATRLEWDATDIESIENNFTETFTENAKPDRNLIPLATLLADDLSRDVKSFPQWGQLQPTHIRRMLDFIDETVDIANDPANGYAFAISNCGALPLSIMILYYYLKAVRNSEPDAERLENELRDPTQETLGDLHEFYRACVRRVINGDIGKTSFVGESMLRGDTATQGLSALANHMNPAVFAGPLADDPAATWLHGRLRTCTKEKSKVVFNAYLLPERGSAAARFEPVVYGQKNKHYQIDHIIPNATGAINEEDRNLQLLVNFCPLIGQDNNTARHKHASAKLEPGGLYATTEYSNHPYMRWLASSQGGRYASADLDNVRLLGEERTPPIGDERIEHLTNVLRGRL